MPKELHIRDICKRCCVWYKPGRKEELSCGGILVIEVLGDDCVLPAEREEVKDFQNRFDSLLDELVCNRCDFRKDGCDFRDPNITSQALPCGGYIHLDSLLTRRLISAAKLRKALLKNSVGAGFKPARKKRKKSRSKKR